MCDCVLVSTRALVVAPAHWKNALSESKQIVILAAVGSCSLTMLILPVPPGLTCNKLATKIRIYQLSNCHRQMRRRAVTAIWRSV